MKAEHIKLLKAMPDEDWERALHKDGSFKPEYMAECCRTAIYNWTIRLMVEPDGGTGMPFAAWKNNFDAIIAWKEALDYWEGKCKENETAEQRSF